MRTLTMILLLFFAFPVYGVERTAKLDGGVTVTITDSPCSLKSVLDMIREEKRKDYQDGFAVFPDRKVRLCWSGKAERGVIFVVDEEGDYGPIPLEAFSPAPKGKSF